MMPRNPKLRKKFLPEHLEERAMLAVLAGDVASAFEPNETIDTAANLGLIGGGLFVQGQSVQVEARLGDFANGVATNTTDVDLYSVDLRSGDLLTVDIDAQRLDDGDELFDPEAGGTESNTDTLLSLFRRDQDTFTLVASNIAAIAPGDSTVDNTIDAAIVDFSVPATDTYFIGVSGADAGTYNPLVATGRNASERTGQYIMTVTVVDDDSVRPDVDVTVPNLSDGEANVVSWEISDESGISSSTAMIWQDDVLIRPNDPVPLSGSFDLGGFGAGEFRITITAVDADNDQLGDQLTNIHSVLFTIADDDTAGPDIQLTPSPPLDGSNNIVSWDVSDDSGFALITAEISRNGQVLFSGDIDPSGEFDLNAEGIGDYSITVSATDADDDSTGDSLSSTETISFSIADDDTEPPQIEIDPPGTLDGTDNTIRWSVSDASGFASVRATISQGDEVLLDAEVDPIGEFDLNVFAPGSYSVTIDAIDGDNDWVGDTLSSTQTIEFEVSDDDTTPPLVTIQIPALIDSLENLVGWTATDPSGVSVDVQITRNGASIFSSDTPQGFLNLNTVGPGDYVITVVAVDQDEDRPDDVLETVVTESFTIIDDDTDAPVINLPVVNDNDGADNRIEWFVSDASGFDSLTATITQGETVLLDGPIEPIGDFDLNPLGLGTFQIEIIATDGDEDWVGDSLSSTASGEFIVTDDDDAAPTIVVTVEDENDGSLNEASWVVEDPSGVDSVSILVTRDNVQIFDRVVPAINSINLDEFGPGEYTIAVRAEDADQDWVGDQRTSIENAGFVITDDDTEAPEIVITPSDPSDGEDNTISWSVTDDSGLATVTATISRNGVEILSGSVDAVGSLDINELGVGNYSISVQATDADDDWADDSLSSSVSADFVVIDDDTQAPEIEISSGAEDGADNVVSWNVTDVSGLASVNVTISMDGEVVSDGAADAEGSLDLNQFGIGNYSISVTAVDADQDWMGDQLSTTVTEDFVVGDDDTEPPLIVFNDPNIDDGENNFIMWTVTDPSGVSSVTARITRGDLVLVDSIEVEAVGSFDLNAVGSADYSITITATDADDDRTEDQTSITQTLDFTITDDDVLPPQIGLIAPDASDGADNQVSWIVSDDSGVQQVVAILSVDGSLIVQTEVAPQGSFDLNSFGVGTFTLRLDVDDADSDWVGDAEGSSEEFTFSITDDDTAAPEIEITTPNELDSETNVVSWTTSDASGISDVSVNISRDGESVFATNTLGQNSFNLDSLGAGEYSITVSATDDDSDRDGDELSATVTETFTIADEDSDPPTIGISLPNDVDGDDNLLMFNVSDASGLQAVSARVSQGDTVLLDGPIPGISAFDLNTFGIGTFLVEVTAEDADNDSEGDSLSATQTQEFTITDDDPDSPAITVTAAEGTDGGNASASWVATDASGFDNVTVQVTLDNVPIIDGPVSAIDSVDLSEFGPGNYTVAVRGDDADNDWVGDSRTSIENIAFTIVDDDTEPPAISIDEGASSDDGDNTVSWEITDPSGVASATVEILRQGVLITSGPVDAIGSLDINLLGIGNYQVTVTATDADEDRADDQLTATVTTSFTITDDDTEAPTITLGNVSPAVDGDDNVVTWEITDDSGISQVLASISRDGTVLRSGPVADGVTSFDLNEFGTGTYTVSIEADDADGDWVGDRTTRIETAVFAITDDDVSGPTIAISPPTGSIQGEALVSSFSWTAQDDAGLSSGFVRLERRLDDTSFELIDEQPIELADSQSTASGETSVEGLGLGTYRLTVGATDADGDRADDESSTVVSSLLSVVDSTAPKVVSSSGEASADFQQFGAVQFIFDEDVSASLDSSDFELRNMSTDEVFAITEEVVWDPAAMAASIDLSGRTQLSRGLYVVALRSTGVSDTASNELDGDADDSAGGDHLAGTFPITWRGDATLNADVEFEDFLIVSNNFGQQVDGWSDGDFDGDGVVGFQDFLWVTWNWDQVPTAVDPAATLVTAADFTEFDACGHSVRATVPGRDDALELTIRNPELLEPNTPTTLNVLDGSVFGLLFDEPSDAFWCNDAIDPEAVQPRAVNSQSGSVTVTISEPFPTSPTEAPIAVNVVANDLLFATENGNLVFDDVTIAANGFGFLPG